MRISLLSNPSATSAEVVFEARTVAELRARLSGHHTSYVLAVEVEIPGGKPEWHIVWPWRNGRPIVTSYLYIRRGLAPAADAETVWQAAQATRDYCRQQAIDIKSWAGWVKNS